jgi:hypothetical protein
MIDDLSMHSHSITGGSACGYRGNIIEHVAW